MVLGGFRQGNGPRGFQPNLKKALGAMHEADGVRPNGYAEAVAIVNRGEALHARRELHLKLLLSQVRCAVVQNEETHPGLRPPLQGGDNTSPLGRGAA